MCIFAGEISYHDMRKYIKWIMAGVMLATFVLMYMLRYEHIIIYHEQHHLFRFCSEWIAETAHQYGFWHPWTQFIVQFGYWPWLGALIWSLMFVGVYLMTQSIIKRLTGLQDLIQLSAILPVWMFYQTIDVDSFPVNVVKAFAIVSAAWLAVVCFARFIPVKYRTWTRKREKKIDIKFKPKYADAKPQKRHEWVWLIVGAICFGGIVMFNNNRYYGPRTIEVNNKPKQLTREDVIKWRENERIMIAADQALRRRDWDKVLELSNQILRKGNNHLMAYFRSLALYHRGELTTRLFDLPQSFGEEALFFPWYADRNRAEYGGKVYEDMGALNSAIHWEFEALVGWGETATHLINLSKYYIETGKPKQAKKFIAPLEDTLFYDDVADYLEDCLEAGDVPDLRDATADVPENYVHFDNVNSIGTDAFFILCNDPSNKMALEYAVMSMLLGNNVGGFYYYLKRYYPDKQNLPRYFWEALCLMRMQLGTDGLAADGYVIPDEVDRDFRAFSAEQKKGQGANFSPAQKQTYWYYASKISKYAPSILIDEDPLGHVANAVPQIQPK